MKKVLYLICIICSISRIYSADYKLENIYPNAEPGFPTLEYDKVGKLIIRTDQLGTITLIDYNSSNLLGYFRAEMTGLSENFHPSQNGIYKVGQSLVSSQGYYYFQAYNIYSNPNGEAAIVVWDFKNLKIDKTIKLPQNFKYKVGKQNPELKLSQSGTGDTLFVAGLSTILEIDWKNNILLDSIVTTETLTGFGFNPELDKLVLISNQGMKLYDIKSKQFSTNIAEANATYLTSLQFSPNFKRAYFNEFSKHPVCYDFEENQIYETDTIIGDEYTYGYKIQVGVNNEEVYLSTDQLDFGISILDAKTMKFKRILNNIAAREFITLENGNLILEDKAGFLYEVNPLGETIKELPIFPHADDLILTSDKRFMIGIIRPNSSEGGFIYCYDLFDSRYVAKINNNSSNFVGLHKNQSEIFWQKDNQHIYFFNLLNSSMDSIEIPNRGRILGYDLSLNEKMLLLTYNKNTEFYDLEKNKDLGADTYYYPVLYSSFLPDNSFIVFVLLKGNYYLVRIAADRSKSSTLDNMPEGYNDLKFYLTNNKNYFVVAADSMVKRYDFTNLNKPTTTEIDLKQNPYSISLTEDGTKLIYSDLYSSGLNIYNYSTGLSNELSMDYPRDTVYEEVMSFGQFNISRNMRYLAASHFYGGISIWNMGDLLSIKENIELDHHNYMTTYPNPATGETTLFVPDNNPLDSIEKIEVYGTNGKSFTFNYISSYTLDLRGMMPGAYYGVIYLKNRKTERFRFTISR